MDYFEEEELEKYYGKDFEDISPTDTPMDEFIVGGGVIECPDCEGDIETRCQSGVYNEKAVSGQLEGGFTDYAYCEECDIEFTRSRTPVSDETSYQYSSNRTDEREEYVCSDCGFRHSITEPISDWEHRETAELHSYERISLNCPCGERHNMNGVSLPWSVECDCGRVFKFNSTDT